MITNPSEATITMNRLNELRARYNAVESDLAKSERAKKMELAGLRSMADEIQAELQAYQIAELEKKENLTMSLNEVFPVLHELKRADKLRVLQFLVIELAAEEGVTLLEAGKSYPVWTPFNSFSAAKVLLETLEADKNLQNA